MRMISTLKQTKAEAALWNPPPPSPLRTGRADDRSCRENDELIPPLIHLDGENEKIMTGTLFGVPWRIRRQYIR
jgi:hypothetical protein